MSPLIVSKHLRHSSAKETLDAYSHVFPNETAEAIDGSSVRFAAHLPASDFRGFLRVAVAKNSLVNSLINSLTDNKKCRFYRHLCSSGRNGGVRTRDLLVPNQAHYQAVLRPDAHSRERHYTLIKIRNQILMLDRFPLGLSKPPKHPNRRYWSRSIWFVS